jgi:hypothetical protein
MEAVLDRIAAWEAAGLIDADTASRLRAHEAGQPDAAASPPDQPRPESHRGPSTIAQIFGPGIAVGEMFAYLGGAFILGAFNAFLIRTAGLGSDGDAGLAIGFGLAAAVLAGIGLYLRRGDPRQRRAAGVMLAVAVGHAAAAAAALTATLGVDFPASGVIVALIAACVAVWLRVLHPAVLTQFALLASLTGLAAGVLSWIERILVPEQTFDEMGVVDAVGGPEPLVLLVGSAVWWLAFALLLGVLGLLEAGHSGEPAAGRRAALTRLWAGITAVLGLATAVMMTDYAFSTDASGRVLEPWLGDVALVTLAAILVERAFRRGANTFLYAAALALIIALSDFNFTYLSDSTEAGLLVEGLILLGAGFAADRLRRRIERADIGTGAAAPA